MLGAFVFRASDVNSVYRPADIYMLIRLWKALGHASILLLKCHGLFLKVIKIPIVLPKRGFNLVVKKHESNHRLTSRERHSSSQAEIDFPLLYGKIRLCRRLFCALFTWISFIILRSTHKLKSTNGELYQL